MAYEIQDARGFVVDSINENDAGNMTVTYDIVGIRYNDAAEAQEDCTMLQERGYDVSLVEVQ